MAANLFTTVRKSLAVKILFSSVLSNLVLFGQPLQAMVINYYQENNSFIPTSYNGNSDNGLQKSAIKSSTSDMVPAPMQHEKNAPMSGVNIFYAAQAKGTIGKLIESGGENPYDNFFNIDLPKDLDTTTFDAILSYDLYGLASASQTTKSINGESSYGGKIIALTDSWTAVQENIHINQLNPGKNEIFFNRRVNENYQYSVKNVRIELKRKDLKSIHLSENILTNFKGSMYVSGLIADPGVLTVNAHGKQIPVVNGIFEYLFDEISSDTKKIEFSYKDVTGISHYEIYPVNYTTEKAKYQFINSILENNALIYRADQAVLYEELAIKIDKINASESGSLIIEGFKFKDVKTSEEDLINVTAGKYQAYHIAKRNIADSIAMQVHLKYEQAQIPEGYTERDIKVYYYDKLQHNWNALAVDSLDIANKEIIATTFNNDTDYINGVIKVPESPETGNFTPTTLSDIKFADPASGVVSIQPPSPNSTGAAATSFPIKLPGGRNGMQPSLQVSYNSEAGNSWMGIGWNLSTPAITLNTKWGAPLFNSTLESELYSLGGSDLVLKVGSDYTNPHRQDNIARSAERQFYYRKEGSYDDIKRHGSNPTNYWWEVTDKMGNKTYYGGYKELGVNSNAVLTTTGQTGDNIAHWAITRVEDQFGNYIEYEYSKDQKPIGASTVMGQTFYPSAIRYTKNDRLNNYYEVQLIRNGYSVPVGNTNFTLRNDAIVNGRNGYISLTKDLLTEIQVSLVQSGQSQKIRTYRFDYVDAAFQKKQLSTIAEYDVDGKLFYSNSMEYYAMGTAPLINSTAMPWSAGSNDPVDSPLPNLPGINTNGSALGTSSSSGYSFGFRAGFGFGINVFNINKTLGGSFNYSKNNQQTLISFLDINGDGLPDKIIRNGSSTFYRPNTGEGFGNLYLLNDISSLSKTKSRTTGGGVDAAFKIFSIGKSWSKTKSETDNYFSDMNGDGLIDFVSNGTVRFNFAPSPGDLNERSFSNANTVSENPIVPGSVSPNVIPDLKFDTMEELREQNPQFDHVKLWEAPYTGVVRIDGAATLIQKNIYTDKDNDFRITIERADANQNSNSASTLYTPSTILSADSSSVPLGLQGITVNKGDKIFFRIHNPVTGYGGKLQWNPQITYTAITGFTTVDLKASDENGKQYKGYDSKADFLMNDSENTDIPFSDTSISLNFNLASSQYSSAPFSDDIKFIIKLYSEDDETGEKELVTSWFQDYNHATGSLSNSTPSYSLTAGTKYTLSVYTESTSNVKWDAINWKPTFTGNNSGLHYISVNHHNYDDNVNQNRYWIYGNSFPTPIIDSHITHDAAQPMITMTHDLLSEDFNSALASYEVGTILTANWVVKRGNLSTGKVLYKRKIYIVKTTLGVVLSKTPNYVNPSVITPTADTDYFIYNLTKQDIKDIKDSNSNLYAAFYIDDRVLNCNRNITVAVHSSQTSNYIFNQSLNRPFLSRTAGLIGNAYRGWSQFLYNGGLKFQHDDEGNITNPGQPENYGTGNIDMSIFGDNQSGNVDGFDEDAPAENLQMSGDGIRYMSYSQDNQNKKYSNSSVIGSRYGVETDGSLTINIGRFGEENLWEVYVNPADITTVASNGIMVGIKQRSESKGSSTTGGVAIVDGTLSKATSKILNQYIDLNGDRYPDLITGGMIQYTNMLGGLSAKQLNNTFTSGDESRDITAGITVPCMSPSSTDMTSSSTSVEVNVSTGLTTRTTTTTKSTKTNTNISAGVNVSDGSSFDFNQWADINGDGLTDKVSVRGGDIKVALNTGYGFTPDFNWLTTSGSFNSSSRTNVGLVGGGGAGVIINNKITKSYAYGLGGAISNANADTMLADVNGDGLPDLLIKPNPLITSYSYILNNGSGFVGAPQPFYNDNVEHDSTIAANVYGAFTFGFFFTILIKSFKVVFTPSVGLNSSFSQKQATLQDINGDGLLDVVTKGSGTSNNGNLSIKLNQVGKTHLLKKVNTPLGGSWTIDYERNGNTYDLPQSKWVVNEIKTHDGFTGDNAFKPDATITKVAYDKPKYDRREREFFGYEIVKVQQIDPLFQSVFRTSITNYHTENYYLSGAQKSTALYGQSGQKLSESSTLYNLLNPDSPVVNKTANAGINYLQTSLIANGKALLDRSRLFVAVASTVSSSYEGNNSLSAGKDFTNYDSNGNLTTYIDWGDGIDDAFRTQINYTTPTTSGVANGVGFPSKVSVYKNASGQLYRQKGATYQQGKLVTIGTKLNQTELRNMSFNYDSYGNLTTVNDLDNLNAANTHFVTTISYDTTLQTFPVSVSNSFGETSGTQYDYLFGTPVFSTDKNLQSMRTRIDNRGRVVEVTGPNELALESVYGNGWTIRMEYESTFTAEAPGAAQPTTRQHYALTRHYDPAFVQDNSNVSTNQLHTVSIVDGFGQAIQLKKNHLSGTTAKWMISGLELKDAFGRTLLSYLSSTQNMDPQTDYTYFVPTTLPEYTSMSYDEKDRLKAIAQPGESSGMLYQYMIKDGMLVQKVTNELSQTMETYTDIRGRQRKTVQNNELTTSFEYNAINELMKVTDPQGFVTSNIYDQAGRQIEMQHPDRGVVTFKYSKSGNLVEKGTSNLQLAGNLKVNYKYDYNRLTNVTYPENPNNNVKYTYGSPSDTYAKNERAVGRLVQQEDATGIQVFGYGRMGEVTKNLRSVAVAGYQSYWFYTAWKYDSWNRIQEITYPDGEIVKYKYNSAGALDGIESKMLNIASVQPVIQKILYDDYGDRSYIKYGNGTVTEYTYDIRRRMNSLKNTFTNFEITKNYTFDVLSNISNVNTAQPQNSLPQPGQIGGTINQAYRYDNYNRLTVASGQYTGANDAGTPDFYQHYETTIEYNPDHTIKQKAQTHAQISPGSFRRVNKNNYILDYSDYGTGAFTAGTGYGYSQPHAVRTIIESPNVGYVPNNPLDAPLIKHKTLLYDANGNQTEIKEKVGSVTTSLRKNLWDEENRLTAVDLKPDDKTGHPISIYTYDSSGERIVRYNSDRMDVSSNAGEIGQNAKDNIMIYPSGLIMGKVYHGMEKTDRVDMVSYTKHYYAGSERVSAKTQTLRVIGSFPQALLASEMPNLNIAAVRAASTASVTDAGAIVTGVYNKFGMTPPPLAPTVENNRTESYHDPAKLNISYFHPDHLGSSSYITNASGIVTQHLEYMAFGEVFVEEHSNSLNSPFKFNGKELDGETGNYYYGARYYDPKLSTFISVDPLAEAQPDKTPYHYCSNNPINRTDPTGMLDDWYLDKTTGKYLGQDGAATNNIRLIDYRDFNDIQAANGGSTTTVAATAQLQSSDMSQTVTINDSQIQQELQYVNDASRTTEHQIYIVLDRANAEVKAERGIPGKDGAAQMEYNQRTSSDNASYNTTIGGNNLLLAGAHGHNLINWAGLKNAPGTSPDDKAAAAQAGVSVYAVEAYNTPVGGQANVSGISAGGTPTQKGKTQGTSGGTGTFNIGLDALKTWSRMP